MVCGGLKPPPSPLIPLMVEADPILPFDDVFCRWGPGVLMELVRE